MSTEQIYSAVVDVIRNRIINVKGAQSCTTLEHLDVGAGQGQLISKLIKEFNFKSSACDYHVDRFDLLDVAIHELNLDKEPLPYQDESFDVITCSEVIEHLENYRRLIGELYRVTRKGGLVVITTPNVLNVKSRLKNVWSGFPELFGPLPVKRSEFYSCGGHITQIPFFYLAQALYEYDFNDVILNIDKYQKSSTALACLLSPALYVGWKHFLKREKNRYQTINSDNLEIVSHNFSRELLWGRTIVVSAFKR